ALGAVVEPFDLAWRARQFGTRPRLAAMRIDEPELNLGGLGLAARPPAIAEKGDPLAIRRPYRLRIGIRTTGKLGFAAIGEAGEDKIRDAQILFLVRRRLHPDEPFAVWRNAVVHDGLVVDEVFGFPRLGLGGRFRLVRRPSDTWPHPAAHIEASASQTNSDSRPLAVHLVHPRIFVFKLLR